MIPTLIGDTAKLQALKANINANSATLATAIAQRDGPAIAAFYNALAGGPFVVWKSLVSLNAVGMSISFAELANLTSLNTTRLQTIFQLSPLGINPYLADRRAAFDDIFSGAGGAVTRPALLALWKRSATVAEKLFATGTGSDAAPATLGPEGALTGPEVLAALDS